MVTGRRSDEWDRASLLAALIHNDPQGMRPRLQADHFHPLKRAATPKLSDPRALAGEVREGEI